MLYQKLWFMNLTYPLTAQRLLYTRESWRPLGDKTRPLCWAADDRSCKRNSGGGRADREHTAPVLAAQGLHRRPDILVRNSCKKRKASANDSIVAHFALRELGPFESRSGPEHHTRALCLYLCPLHSFKLCNVFPEAQLAREPNPRSGTRVLWAIGCRPFFCLLFTVNPRV